jgi:hypothetical protein
MKKLALLALVAGLVYVSINPNAFWSLVTPKSKLQATAYSLAGRTEQEVIDKLGDPNHIVRKGDLQGGRTVDYPWQAMGYMPVPTQPVHNKVLLYSELKSAVYIFLDEHGNVEYVSSANA